MDVAIYNPGNFEPQSPRELCPRQRYSRSVPCSDLCADNGRWNFRERFSALVAVTVKASPRTRRSISNYSGEENEGDGWITQRDKPRSLWRETHSILRSIKIKINFKISERINCYEMHVFSTPASSESLINRNVKRDQYNFFVYIIYMHISFLLRLIILQWFYLICVERCVETK